MASLTTQWLLMWNRKRHCGEPGEAYIGEPVKVPDKGDSFGNPGVDRCAALVNEGIEKRTEEVVTMLYILLGLVFAAFFGTGAVAVYGYEGLLSNPWVQYVFWWLIGTGALLALVESLGSIPIRLGRWRAFGRCANSAVPSH